MAQYKRKQTKRPPAVFYELAVGILRLFCYFILGYRVRYRDPVPKTGPLMVIGNHAGLYDALFMATALKSRRLNFVTTERFFHIPLVGGLFRFLGVIPRIQFQADPRSIAAILRVTRDGGALGLFPAGQTSMCGTPTQMPPAIARLIQRSGATVVVLHLDGAYMTKARFQRGFNRGRVQGQVSVLFTPQQLAEASQGEVYRAVCDALHYDDYRWQEETGHTFRGPGLARGYERVLYRCPQCQSEYTMVSDKDTFGCRSCGYTVTVGPDMHMHPVDGGPCLFPTVRDWYGWQAQLLYRAIDDPAAPFRMEIGTRAQLYQGSRLFDAGSGTLWLNREHMGFTGRLMDQEGDFAIAHANLFGTATETGVYLELYHPQLGLVHFLPDNPMIITPLKVAQEYLYSKTIEV